MTRWSISRRAMLRGALGGSAVAIGLPMLERFLNHHGDALADGTAIPKRFGVWFWGNGVRLDHWTPSATGATWDLTSELQPFAPVKKYLSVVSGLKRNHNGTAHHDGWASMLTGTYSTDTADTYRGATGPTIDQIAAAAWNGQAPHRSLEIGVSQRGKATSKTSDGASKGPTGQKLPADYSPESLYSRFFAGGVTGSDPKAAAQARMRVRALDAVLEDAARLRKRLGTSDQKRLDAHLDGIAEIEHGLSAGGSAGCVAPTAPVWGMQDLDKENLRDKHDLISKILVKILACDLTRVFSVAFTTMQNDVLFWYPEIMATEGLHVMTHDDRPNTPTPGLAQNDKVHLCVLYAMQCFADLLTKMQAETIGAGNLLDHTCLMATSEVAEGTSHGHTDCPILIVGAAGGSLKSGLHYRSPNEESVSKALLTCLHAVDINQPSIGDAVGFADTTLSSLQV